MLFTSLEFLLLFFPICLIVYYILPSRFGLRNYWLLAASLAFYAWGEPSFVFVMLGSIAFNYAMAFLLDWLRDESTLRKAVFWTAICGNLLIIGTWKYANFLTANLREFVPILKGVVPQTSFLLPIGISFFTFQAISYVIDVERRDVRAQRNPFYLALYIALFPQLIAGPIVRYSTVCAEIESRRTTLEDFSSGVQRFLGGFAKKMLLANVLAVTADKAFGLSTPSCMMAWLGAICYTFQIYYDFSGYSDMAIGLGRMFGFHFEENFNFPYVSKTVTEFWRRWHITLGSWFRDYVYFPLGGSRVGKIRLIFNLAVVWCLTGVWHGANWPFFLWGALFGVLIMFEKLVGLPKHVEQSKALRMLVRPITMLMVILGWVLFRSLDISQALDYLAAMFRTGITEPYDDMFMYELYEIRYILIAAVLFSTPVWGWLRTRFAKSVPDMVELYDISTSVVNVLLFVVGVSYLVMNAHNPFIYFNF